MRGRGLMESTALLSGLGPILPSSFELKIAGWDYMHIESVCTHSIILEVFRRSGAAARALNPQPLTPKHSHIGSTRY